MLLGIHFDDTFTLSGSILIAIATLFALYRIALGARMRGTNEIQGKTIVALGKDRDELERQLHDCEQAMAAKDQRLNELGAEKDVTAGKLSAALARVHALEDQIEALPKYKDFMDYAARMLSHLDQAAAARQEDFLGRITRQLDDHDEHVRAIHSAAEDKAHARHEAQLNLNQSIVAALDALTARLERNAVGGHATKEGQHG